MFDNRRREGIGVNEGQRPYTHHATSDQIRCIPPRQYNSARHRHWSVNTESYDVGLPVKKVDGVDRAFPLKPVYHKRSPTLGTRDSLVPYEIEQFGVSSQPRGHSEHNGKNGYKKPMEVPPLSSEVLSDSRDVKGSQQQRGDRHRFPHEQQRRAREIHEMELLLQEKLLRTGETLRRIQRERATSDDKKRREEKEEGSYGRRRQAEQEKERTEIRVSPPAEWQRREVMSRKEGARQEWSIEREKAKERTERHKERQEERNNGRIRNIQEERNRWERRDSRTEKKPQPSRGERTERVTRYERGENRDSERWEEENFKGEEEWNRGNGRNEKANKLVGDEGETSQREREKGRGRERPGKRPEEDIDGQRGNKWERPYKESVSKETYRYVSNEHKKEEDISYKGQQKSTRRLVTETHNGREKRVPGEPSVSTRSHSSGLQQEPSVSTPSHSGRLRQKSPCVTETHDGRGKRAPGEPSVTTPSHSSRLQQVEPLSADGADNCPQLLPCKICHRNFAAAERLEKHLKICQKLQQSTRKVFDASTHRAKGTDLEKFPRSKTPERYRKKGSTWRQKHVLFIRNIRQVQSPDGTSRADPSIRDNPDYETCPHCLRRFAPGPAERHIPKCQNIKSRPPPPRRHQQK